MSRRPRHQLFLATLLLAAPLAHADPLDTRMEVASGRFSGMLGVQEAGQSARWTASGVAAPGVPHREDVAYPIASVTKPVTAVAVMRLVEQGRLSLDDRLDKHWPEAAGYPTAAVTIGQLLDHTSGIPSVLHTEQGLDETLDPAQWPLPTTTAAQLAPVLPMPLRFEPGSRYEYNNSAYLILGEVVARLAGKPADEAVIELALGPAGVADEACFCEQLPGFANAVGYEYDGEGGVRPAVSMHPTRTGTAGGLRITLRALLAWGRALVDGRVLQPQTLQAMWSDGKPTRQEGETMGLGWLVRSGDGLVLHDGTVPGTNTALAIDRSSGRVAVGVLSPTLDMDRIARSEAYIGARVAALAQGRRPASLPLMGDQDALDLAGEYRLVDGRTMQLRRVANGWELSMAEGSPLGLAQTVRLDDAQSRKALEAVAAWATGGQAALLPYMQPDLRKALPEGALDGAWASWVEGKGAHRGAYAYAVSRAGTVRVRLDFERGYVDIGFGYDGEGLIDGLGLHGEDRGDLPHSAVAQLTGNGELWLDGYRAGLDAVTLHPRIEAGRVRGLWIGRAGLDGAYIQRTGSGAR